MAAWCCPRGVCAPALTSGCLAAACHPHHVLHPSCSLLSTRSLCEMYWMFCGPCPLMAGFELAKSSACCLQAMVGLALTVVKVGAALGRLSVSCLTLQAQIEPDTKVVGGCQQQSLAQAGARGTGRRHGVRWLTQRSSGLNSTRRLQPLGGGKGPRQDSPARASHDRVRGCHPVL